MWSTQHSEYSLKWKWALSVGIIACCVKIVFFFFNFWIFFRAVLGYLYVILCRIRTGYWLKPFILCKFLFSSHHPVCRTFLYVNHMLWGSLAQLWPQGAFFVLSSFPPLQAARNNALLAVPAFLYAINNYLKFTMQVYIFIFSSKSFFFKHFLLTTFIFKMMIPASWFSRIDKLIMMCLFLFFKYLNVKAEAIIS